MPAKVTGERELMQNFRRLQGAPTGKILDEASRQALEPLRAATQANAFRLRQVGYNPPGGHLDQGVVTRKIGSGQRYRREHWVSFTKRARKIAHLVEFGTAPHWQPRRRIFHPGARPKPFFRPAFELTKNQVISHFGQRIWKQIEASIVASMGRR